MIGNNYLLDANVIIDLFKGNVVIADRLRAIGIMNVPTIVLGELYLGAHRSANLERHLDQISKFLERCRLIPVDEQTAEHYGRIKAALLKKGKPIPENDIWIAAIAEQYDLTLISTDRHFDEIEDLSRESWR